MRPGQSSVTAALHVNAVQQTGIGREAEQLRHRQLRARRRDRAARAGCTVTWPSEGKNRCTPTIWRRWLKSGAALPSMRIKRIDQRFVVHALLAHGHRGEHSAVTSHAKDHIVRPQMHGTDAAFNLDPLAIQCAGEQLRQSDLERVRRAGWTGRPAARDCWRRQPRSRPHLSPR